MFNPHVSFLYFTVELLKCEHTLSSRPTLILFACVKLLVDYRPLRCNFINQKNILGIVGTVENMHGLPMTQSTIKIQGIERSYAVSKRLGYFKCMLPPGVYIIRIACHEYQDQNVTVTVSDQKLSKLKIYLVQDRIKLPEVYQGTIVSSAAQEIDITDKSISERFKGNIKTGIKGINYCSLAKTLIFFYILGYIRDQLNRPVPKAVIRVTEKNITEISDKNGRYGIPLPFGNYTLRVNAEGYFVHITSVTISSMNTIPIVLMITLNKDMSFWGIPRLAFVLLTGKKC